ncbi:MAG TPA: TetR/AcrR family transcriptional regulator [Thermotogota bacterium]|nr:TetR/AcrR family transcriptional regulator [Thermotogota bacterium]HPJ87638.1 TetR/AcrR family transcriptional regulator [Thermotogota bacterium]HPR94924.1 TetR/AcrR family transcriptional regulator [Thermotogota bacterium]
MPKKVNTKRKILDSAKKIFAIKGFDGTSVEEIANEAGVKKALIFYYFPSKESLFLESWTEGINELEHHIFGDTENETGYLAKLKKVLISYIDFVMNRKEIMKLIEMDKVKIIESESQGDKNLHPLKVRYNLFIEKIETLIEEGKEKQFIPESIPTGGTAKLIAQSIGVNAMNEDLSVDSIVKFILNGMSVREDFTE